MLVKTKPTSPGRRHMVKVVHPHLHKGGPERSLVESQSRGSGRNNNGHITVRHKGGGHKQAYRLVDFRRNKTGVAGKVERIEYDPNRSAHIALVLYADGERAYILAPSGIEVGSPIQAGADAPIKPGCALPLRNVPIGIQIHNVEMRLGAGGQLARSAGTSITLVDRDSEFAILRLRSGEMRKVNVNCMATIGTVSNSEHSLREYGKAGAKRWRGIRPTVRGVVMNPVDHPMGGGEGRSSGGRHPCSPWGWATKGKKTRNNKRTDGMIIKRRNKK